MDKICTKCKIALPLACFNKKSGRTDQYMSYCKECYKLYRKDQYLKTKEHEKIIRDAWYINNRDKKAQYEKTFRKDYYAKDSTFRLGLNIRVRLNNVLRKNKGYIAGQNIALDNLGCTVEELKKYLESKFKPGMTWDNWSRDGWHIDHKKPLSSFDLTNPEHLKIVCHYTNLQPLWAEDNLIKGSKYE